VPAFRGMNIITPCRYKSGFFISAYGGGTSYLEIQKTENGYRTQEKWKTTIQGYMSTPIIVGKYAYMHLRNQRVTCIDIGTGKTQWTSTPFGKYWSMVSDGNRILALDEAGTLYLLNANPEKLEILDSYKLDTSNTWAHIGIVNGHILIRDLRQLICLKWKENISITPSKTTN
jgi:outer membrane protein assembly factor BamB